MSSTAAIDRRKLLAGFASFATTGLATPGRAEADPWGAGKGYPTGWGPPGQTPRWEAYPEYRVGNFTGGYESMFRHRTIEARSTVAPLTTAPRSLYYTWSGQRKSVDDYLSGSPVYGLLIARKGEILFERYRMDRQPNMRFQSWSMAKSVTSLLVGIALDRKLIRSIDDTPGEYVPSLRGTLHGGIPMRYLLNMCSGVEVQHERDAVRIDVPALLGQPAARAKGTDVEKVVREWSAMREAPGVRFNYTELCPLTMGMVVRAVSGQSLAEFATQHLWSPIGAEAPATWLTDSLGKEYNCVGFAATLRDWARVAQMIAQRGTVAGRPVVSASWLDECASHGPKDRAASFGVMRADMGYRNFFWLPRSDGRWLMMNGAHGQRVLIDRRSQTVLIQTSVSQEGWSQAELLALFDAAAS
jgi:CubicO group peptidase (beta-lactamase class C family)